MTLIPRVGRIRGGRYGLPHPYTIHAGGKNQSPQGRIRVSTDIRFVDKTKPYDERWTYLAYSEDDPNMARKIELRQKETPENCRH